MTQPANLTPVELYETLIRWKDSNPDAYQLDGSKSARSNRGAFCYVVFNGAVYKLAKDTNIHGINRFLRISEKLKSPNKALKVSTTNGHIRCLRINEVKDQANGWFCYKTNRQISNSEKKAA